MAIAYKPNTPGIYLLSSIFDRDIDGDPQTSLKIVPAVGSLIVFPNNILKQVTHVDDSFSSPTYLKVTYGDVVTSLPDPDLELINYGRDVLMLYYDKRQSPTRIVVDSKLRLIGSNTTGYRIIRTLESGQREVLSLYLDTEGSIVGNLIPVNSGGVDNVLIFGTGYTLVEIIQGEILTLELIDSAGIITGTATLIAKEATILNTIELASNPIIGFDAECSQISGDNWILYVGQDINELSIHPYISFADGTRRIVPINNMSTYMYGYEDINTNLAGNIYPIVIKYYLGSDEQSTISQDIDGTKFVTMTKNVIIGSLEKFTYSKISVVPIWNSGTSRYSLRYIGYVESRNIVTDVTSLVSYVSGFGYNNALYNLQQEIRITVPFENEDGNTVNFNQTFFLTVSSPGQSQPFLIQQTVDGVAYGSENALYNRPSILYDGDLQQYFISSIRFVNSTELLRNFYLAGSPPWLIASEIQPPTPTHFTIRDSVSLRTLVAPIPIEDYEEAFTLSSLTTPDAFANSTVIVEWLIEFGGLYKILYGTPVEVFISETGYIG